MIKFRLSENDDPEERIEEAALWKAVHDEFGDEVELISHEDHPGEGLFIGRMKRYRGDASVWIGHQGPFDYWRDEAFLSRANRPFALCTLREADEEVARLHADGHDAFVKATQQKLFTSPVPRGKTLRDVLDDLVYSFIDCPPCLMVQQWCEFEFERRYIVVDREIVTSSPIAWHLTPIDHWARELHFQTPRDMRGARDDALLARMDAFATEAARQLNAANTCLDLALIDGRIGIVELNPLQFGQLGLYACDVRAIAKSIRKFPVVRPA